MIAKKQGQIHFSKWTCPCFSVSEAKGLGLNSEKFGEEPDAALRNSPLFLLFPGVGFGGGQEEDD